MMDELIERASTSGACRLSGPGCDGAAGRAAAEPFAAASSTTA